MWTACFSTYHGPGRIALSPPPAGTARGYRLAPVSLFFRSPITPAALRGHLSNIDPADTWASLHRLVYPTEPILTGSAAPGIVSLRTVIADWFAFHGHPVSEINPETHRPRRVRPMAVAGLVALIAASPAGAVSLETVTDSTTGCLYVSTGGAVTPRLRRDGLPDCPDTGTAIRDETMRDLVREVTTLRREVEALRRR